MQNLKGHLKNRLNQLSTPTPTISIFRGKKWLVSDTGAQGSREEVYVQLDVTFRNHQLAQLKGAKLAVFLCIALHINEDGICFPSVSRIVKETGYSRDTVHVALKGLETMGFISRVSGRREDKTHKYKSNSYRIFPKSWQPKQEEP
jgi:hypothetical protein